jgi:putative Holliday junction resolvase
VLATLVQREAAQAVICGLPLNMDGSEGERAQSIRKWAMRLAHALRALLGAPLPVIFWDER